MSESNSLYTVPLERTSQIRAEESNASDPTTDMYLMNPGIFRQTWRKFIRDPKKIQTGIDIYNHLDPQKREYPGIMFATGPQRRIVGTKGAGPCTLAVTYDNRGNCAVAHLLAFKPFMDEPEDESITQEITSMNAFIRNHINTRGRMLITGTNIIPEIRSRIIESLKQRLNWTKDISMLFVNPKEPGPLYSTTIHSLFFFPKTVTTDSKNKLYLIGNGPNLSQEEDNDLRWMVGSFSKEFTVAD